MKREIAVSIATVVLCLGGLVVTQAGAATRTVSASGGSLRFTATVRNATTCHWSLSPAIPSFTTTVKCKTGTVSRAVKFPANTSTTARAYTVTLTVRGKTTTVDHWKVTQAAETPPTTTTTTTTLISVSIGAQFVNGSAIVQPVAPGKYQFVGSFIENAYGCTTIGVYLETPQRVPCEGAWTWSVTSTPSSTIGDFGAFDGVAEGNFSAGTYTITATYQTYVPGSNEVLGVSGSGTYELVVS